MKQSNKKSGTTIVVSLFFVLKKIFCEIFEKCRKSYQVEELYIIEKKIKRGDDIYGGSREKGTKNRDCYKVPE